MEKEITWIDAMLRIPVGHIDISQYQDLLIQADKLNFGGRSNEDLLKILSEGHPPCEWKRRKLNNNLIIQIRAISGRSVEHEIDNDLLSLKLADFLLQFLPDGKVIEINTWWDANKYGVLKTYFGDKDIFNLVSDTSSSNEYSFGLAVDYYDYVLSQYGIHDRVKMYQSHLICNSRPVPYEMNSYCSPYQCVESSLSQMIRYGEWIEQIDDHLEIVSDGVGTISMACVQRNKEYVSEEINGIGEIARNLEIITGELSYTGVLIVANANYDRNIELIDKYDKVLWIDEGGDFKSDKLVKLPNTGGRLWSKNLDLDIVYLPSRNVVDYISNLAPVKPMDVQSENFCIDNDLLQSEDGRKISVSNKKHCYNIRTRTDPNNLYMAKVGDIKLFNNIEFVYETPGRRIVSDDASMSYYPGSGENLRVLYPGKYVMKNDMYYAQVSNPRQIKYVMSAGLRPVYYLFTRLEPGGNFSYYSETTFRVKVPDKSSDNNVGRLDKV